MKRVEKTVPAGREGRRTERGEVMRGEDGRGGGEGRGGIIMWNSSYIFRTGGSGRGKGRIKKNRERRRHTNATMGNSIRETLTRMEFVYVCIGHWQRAEREREEGNIPAQSCR